MIALPDVVGQPIDQAQSNLEQLGLKTILER